ncbi:MAG: hypothetical protein JNM80_02235 [Phycisphaerae bacterium]|nr:hypothetical protein [Phycisphaerae bacterium]
MRTTLKMMLLCGMATSAASAQVIYDNGPLSTGATTTSGVAAPAGTTWSEVQDDGSTTCSNTVAGFSCGIVGASLFRIADDFTIPAGQSWTINTISIYAYQTGSLTSTPVFTAANIQIWNGRPGDAGSTVVFGDTTTNRLATQAFDNVYRVFNTQTPPPGTAPGTTRGVRKLDLTIGTTLPAGTYWIDWQTSIGGASAHFSPSTTFPEMRGMPGANARQFQTTVWVDLLDTGNPAGCGAGSVPQDSVFKINGTIQGGGGGCYANCDNSTIIPFLNINDFVCFNNKFAAGDTNANCDQSTITPVLNVNDFICFNNLFAAGCSAP